MTYTNYKANNKSSIKVCEEDLNNSCDNYLNKYPQEHFLPMNVSSYYAFESAGLGVWSFDCKTKTLRLCKRCKKLMGIPEDHQISTTYLSDFLSADQEAGLIEAIITASAPGIPFCYQFQNNNRSVLDRRQQWLRITGIMVAGKSGRKEFHGTLCDISVTTYHELSLTDNLAIVKHEMRTPLSCIKLYIQLCQSFAGTGTDNRIAKFLNRADEMVNKAVTLLDYFGEGPGLQTGSLMLNIAEFDISALLTEITANFRFTHPNHLFILTSTSQTVVSADRERIGQVIQNLLANAAKYSPDPDTILIKCILLKKHIQVSVKDHGIGIGPEEKDKVFEKYYRVDNGSHKIDGQGIGLYLCKCIIEGHGGEIAFKSDKDKGSTFYFRLPLS